MEFKAGASSCCRCSLDPTIVYIACTELVAKGHANVAVLDRLLDLALLMSSIATLLMLASDPRLKHTIWSWFNSVLANHRHALPRTIFLTTVVVAVDDRIRTDVIAYITCYITRYVISGYTVPHTFQTRLVKYGR